MINNVSVKIKQEIELAQSLIPLEEEFDLMSISS